MTTIEALKLRQSIKARNGRENDELIRLVDAFVMWARESLLPDANFDSPEDKYETIRTCQADTRRLEQLLTSRIGSPVTITVQGFPLAKLVD